MTGTKCCVDKCGSYATKTKLSGEIIRYFTFPKDPKIRKQWVRLCYRKDEFDPNKRRICSRHFQEEQYEDRVEAQIKGTVPKRLKKDAVPTIHLPVASAQNVPTERQKRMARREQKKVVETLLKTTGNNSIFPSPDSVLQPIDKNVPTVSRQPTPYELLFQKFETLKKQYESLKRDISDKDSSIAILKRQKNTLLHQMNELHENIESKIKDVLFGFLTPNQMQFLLKNKLRGKWSSEDIPKAFALRYFSKRTYIYMASGIFKEFE